MTTAVKFPESSVCDHFRDHPRPVVIRDRSAINLVVTEPVS